MTDVSNYLNALNQTKTNEYLANLDQQNVNAYLASLAQKTNAAQAAAAPAAAPGKPSAIQLQNADAQLKHFLETYGLSNMADKTWKYIQDNGIEDQNQLMLWVYEQPEFKARFPALATLQKKGRAITPADYIGLEKQYASVMKQGGMAGTLFDKPADFTKLIENDVAPAELQQRVNDGYARVANADPTVRSAFAKFFGVKGDAALAAFFLDPAKAAPRLIQAVQASEVSGAATQAGFNVDLSHATRLAQMGVSQQQALSGFNKMNEMKDLFTSGLDETQVNVAATPGVVGGMSSLAAAGDQGTTSPEADLGIAAVFGTDGRAATDLARRLEQRKAAVFAETQNDTIDRQGRGALGTAE